MAATRKLVLASGSASRKMLLERLGTPFEAIAPDVDETPLPGEPPHDTALRLSLLKAKALASRGELIIGSDQVCSSADSRYGKPGGHEAAARQLRQLSGRTADFHTGVALFDTASGTHEARVVLCRVTFRTLSEARIESYLRKDKPYDCAGAAKSEGLGIALIARMETDDPTSLVGLPLIALSEMLERAGVRIL